MGQFGMMEMGMEKMEQVSGREIGETSSQASEVVQSSAVRCSAAQWTDLGETGLGWTWGRWALVSREELGGPGLGWQVWGGKERCGRAS